MHQTLYRSSQLVSAPLLLVQLSGSQTDRGGEMVMSLPPLYEEMKFPTVQFHSGSFAVE